MTALTLLVVGEGHPDTWDCWSGCARGLVTALRRAGVHVVGRDADLYGLRRLATAVMSWSQPRARWAARYHCGALGFAARSGRAHAGFRGVAFDAVLQIGATFDALRYTRRPGFLYCDANCRLAQRYAPYGDVPALRPAEIDRMAAREGRVYERAATIFTMSEYARRSFLQDFSVPEDRVTTVHAGANLDATSPAARSPRRDGPPTVLFVGRLWERKGGPMLLKAFHRVRQACPEARLRIVGATPAVGDEPGVEVVGSVNKAAPGGQAKLLQLYETADVFCMPSRYEPFGTVFAEAMLHGLPCVAANHCAMPEIIEDGRSGWLVPDGDVTALAHCLTRILADRGALAAAGARARERALQLFTWDRVAERMLAVMKAGALQAVVDRESSGHAPPRSGEPLARSSATR